jgi:hypothetical protein
MWAQLRRLSRAALNFSKAFSAKKKIVALGFLGVEAPNFGIQWIDHVLRICQSPKLSL